MDTIGLQVRSTNMIIVLVLFPLKFSQNVADVNYGPPRSVPYFDTLV